MFLCKLIHSDRLFIDFRSEEQTEQKRDEIKQAVLVSIQRAACSEG